MEAEDDKLIPIASNAEEAICDDDKSSQNEYPRIRVRDDLFTNEHIMPTEAHFTLSEINVVVDGGEDTATGLRKCFDIWETFMRMGGHCNGTKGRDRDVMFSWGLFTKGCVFFGIPYVFRERDPEYRYCAVSIVDHILRKYHSELMCQDLLPWLQTRHMDNKDAKMFNHIRELHYKMETILPEKYSKRDVVISYTDVQLIVRFLTNCNDKFTSGDPTRLRKFGYVKKDNGFVLPYVVRENDNKRMIPFYHFEGRGHHISRLSGFDHSYIKLLSLIQGIQRRWYDRKQIQMVELDMAFPPESYEEYWPPNLTLANLPPSDHHMNFTANIVSVKF